MSDRERVRAIEITRTRNVHKERSMTKGTFFKKISLVMKDKKVFERQEQQRKHVTCVTFDMCDI